MTKTKHGNTGKKNAIKDGRNAHLHIRVSREFKSAVDAAAGHGSTSDWVIDACRKKLERSAPNP